MLTLKLKLIIGAVSLALIAGGAALMVSRHYEKKLAVSEAQHQSAAAVKEQQALVKQGEANAYAKQRDEALVTLAETKERERKAVAKAKALMLTPLPTLPPNADLPECEKQFAALTDECQQRTEALTESFNAAQDTNKGLQGVVDLQVKENGALRGEITERIGLDLQRKEQIADIGKRAQAESNRANWWRTGAIGLAAVAVVEYLRKK